MGRNFLFGIQFMVAKFKGRVYNKGKVPRENERIYMDIPAYKKV